MQGLILENTSNWPSFLTDKFKMHHLKICQELSKKKITMLEAALLFIHNCKDIETFLIGITNVYELREIIKIWNSFKDSSLKLEAFDIDFSWSETNEIDPRTWRY